MTNISRNSAGKYMPIIGLIGLWAIYSLLYIVLKQYGMQLYAGYLALICEVSRDIIAVCFSFYLWKKSENQTKIIFLIFFVSFLFAAVTDTGYNIFANILSITNFTNFTDSIFDIPFLGFLIAQLLAWILISEFKIINLYILLIILALVVFGIAWEIKPITLIGSYITIDTILQMLIFVFASLSLITSTNKPIHIIAIGFLIITASDFVLHFKILTKVLYPASLLEITWVLGLLLMIFGFYSMIKKTIELQI